MQPYTGTSQDRELLRPAADVVTPSDRLQDLFNVLVILNCYLILLFMVPPQHEYPVMDDWIYAASARDMYNTGVFSMPDWSQANLVGLIAWGVLWAKLFGLSFTVLTCSVLFLSVGGLIAFYGILRTLGVPYWGALLGALLLGFNPVYLHLSYAFMTDSSFLAIELMACYFMLRGVKASGERGAVAWLVTGSLFAGWAFLIRQFGLLVPVAFAGYLVLNGLATRRWSMARILSVTISSGAVLGAWYLWTRNWPATWAIGSGSSRAAVFVLQPPWIRVILGRWLTYLPFMAIFAVTAIRIRRRSWFLVPIVLAVMVAGMYLIKQAPELQLTQYEPPFTVQAGPVSFELPQESYTFGLEGSIVRPTGFDFDEFGYTQQQIWSPEVWRLLWAISVVLAAIIVTKLIDTLLRPWWRKRIRDGLPPALAFYIIGAGVFLITTLFVGDIFMRYSLGFMPFLILFMVRDSGQWGRTGWAISIAFVAVLVAFSTLAQADNVEHDNVRWQAGLWMEARTAAVRVGWNWDHWGHTDSETYHVTDVHQDGYRIDRMFPYTSRLSGFTTRYVLAESRQDMPPLPEPRQGP